MTAEALLAYAHLLAILTFVVFLSSEAALCRAGWLNAAVVERLVTVDRICGLAALAVLLTGMARMFFGAKGLAWYGHQPLLWLKLGMFVVMGGLAVRPTITFRRWRRVLRESGGLPAEPEIRATRRWVMLQAHILPFIPLPAVFLARGF